MQYPGTSSDEEPRLPPNVLNSQRRGWAGENLEIEHQRESLGDGGKKSQTAAVDLSQFRNEEVGKGYQAKHVVRQREAAAASAGVVDMSGGAFELKDDRREKKSSKREKKEKKSVKRKREKEQDISGQKDNRLDIYLKCKGLETFLGEVEKMLSR
jgi:formylglycine-generating enzyme required for sulfatase activity